ncbi:MAG: hypothetical protein CMO81_01740 [Waddliaceae bacterium]|nr:hypothetical protein [Waddliaceae bacterium]
MLRFGKKIPVTIHPIFWLLVGVLGFLLGQTLAAPIIWVCSIALSVLVHEYGHALTAVSFGQKASIDLVGLGGITRRNGPEIGLLKEAIIVANGPLFTFFIVAVSTSVIHLASLDPENPALPLPIIGYFINLAYLNGIWAVLNLLPIMPLDGGQLLRIGFQGAFGFKGIRWATVLSVVFAFAFAGLAAYTGQFFLLVVFSLFAMEGVRHFQALGKMTEADQNKQLQEELQVADIDFQLGRWEEALLRYQNLRGKAQAGMLYAVATERVASILSEHGQLTEAYEILKEISASLGYQGKVLLQKLAFQSNDHTLAMQLGIEIAKEQTNAEVSFINAMCYAMKGDVRSAVGWLENSIHEGLDNPSQALARKEFDLIRQRDEFQACMEEINDSDS